MKRKGYNKASQAGKILWEIANFELGNVSTRPCVFLSHMREDKYKCREIAEYFEEAEIDYYLDELDTHLQSASEDGNAKLITEIIKKGISESSHMLVIVSENTFKSQWVPFEIGYGHSAILDKELKDSKANETIQLSILTLKNISEEKLPDFMQVGNILRGIKSLNKYISEISNKPESRMVNESLLYENNYRGHPLKDILNSEL